jgi:competence protein ComEC
MLAFAALTGAEPSVIRALAMGLTIAVALAWGRPARALAALCASVVVLLAVDPMLASALGFQLSVAAVAGIVLWSPHLALRFATVVTPAFARVLAIPTAAMGSTLPLIVGIAGGVGLYSVPANVVAGAAAGPVTLLGLAAAVLGGVWPGAASALLQAAALAVRPVDWAARAFSDAPGAWLEWPPAPWGGPLAAAIVVCVIAATTSRRVRGWWRIAALLAVVGLAASTPAFSALRAPHLPHWDVVACDVGQGDMLLLRSSPTGAVVIDTGPPGGEGAACLRRFGVRSVDLLILTHPHADHDGAVAELLAAVPVTQAWISPAARGESAHEALEHAGVSVSAISSPYAATVGDVDIRVLHPPAAWRTGTADGALNDASLTLWADASGTTVLALGDLETQGQESLARSLGGALVVDVVKIAHHGSPTQSEGLASLITARVGIVSVGEDNTYGHPAASTEAMYARRVQALLRTDTCGDIAITTDNGVRIATRCPVGVAG